MSNVCFGMNRMFQPSWRTLISRRYQASSSCVRNVLQHQHHHQQRSSFSCYCHRLLPTTTTTTNVVGIEQPYHHHHHLHNELNNNNTPTRRSFSSNSESSDNKKKEEDGALQQPETEVAFHVKGEAQQHQAAAADNTQKDKDDKKKKAVVELDKSLYTLEVEIKMPDMGEGQGKVLKWYKQPGDVILRRDVLCDIETPDFTFGMETDDEHPAVMGEILVPAASPTTSVPDGTVICKILHPAKKENKKKDDDDGEDKKKED